MEYINTGKERITLLSLLAVWSISLVVDLPGLAITPVMSNLTRIFPGVSHLEVQLLSILPNFLIIPFILLSGRLSMSKDKVRLVNLGMAIFLLSAIACFFAKSMTALIITSCTLGIGCGLVIPLAAGIIADLFTGRARMRQMGIKSGIANFSLIIATLVVGWVGARNWHLSFLVYLLPIIPLCLSPFLSRGYLARTAQPDITPTTANTTKGPTATPIPISASLRVATSSAGARHRAIFGIMVFYLSITVCTIVISYYIPFVMSDYHQSSSQSGLVTGTFFLFITLAGFVLPEMVKLMRNSLTVVCLCLMIGGLIMIALVHTVFTDIVAVMAIGFGYGLLQPIFYNKAAMLASGPTTATRVIAYVMAANYLGTAVTPLVFTGIGDLFHIPGHTYVFWLGTAFLAVTLILSLIFRQKFVFHTSINDC